jgi:hypothetical protein
MSATERNWEEMGISWSEEDVSRQQGPHATDRRVIGKAQIPVVGDLGKFRAHFGDEVVLGILDGTSIRVQAQDVSRTGIAKGLKVGEIRERMYLRLKGIRNRPLAGETKTVVKYPLPGGAFYTGSNVTEYQQQYVAALVDMGTPSDVARTIAATITL